MYKKSTENLTKEETEAQHKAGVTATAPEWRHEMKPRSSQVFQLGRGNLLQRLSD